MLSSLWLLTICLNAFAAGKINLGLQPKVKHYNTVIRSYKENYIKI